MAKTSNSARHPVVTSTTYQARSWDKIYTDTSGGTFTVTLPASPDIGDTIEMYDATGYWATNKLIVDGNGKDIDGDAANFEADVSSKNFTLTYISLSYGWSVT